MSAVKQFDNALCRPRDEIGRLIRSRCFNGTSKAVSQSNSLRAGFVSPQSLNYLGFLKIDTAKRRVGAVCTKLNLSTTTEVIGARA
jgi:hypothetical protein